MIPLPSGRFGLGLLDCDKDVVALDLVFEKPPLADFIVEATILFRVVTFRGVVGGRRGWKLIGHTELSPELQAPGRYFHQAVGSNDLSIYQDGVYYPAALDDICGLERFAVWGESHILKRFEDVINGMVSELTVSVNRVHRYDPDTGQEIF